jgi:alpha-L-rhamnosidase
MENGLSLPNPLLARARLLEAFSQPPNEFAPISFYFWNGEKLTRERLSWQLEQLRAQGILGTIISYIHRPDGTIDPGDPPVFSEDWWALLGWFLQESKRLGMRVGVQDYCIVNPTLEALASEHAELRGAELGQVHGRVSGGKSLRLELPEGATAITVRAYRSSGEHLRLEASLGLLESLSDGHLEWSAPDGDWCVVAVYATQRGFNPLHPLSGARAIERLYAPFEARCADEIGRTLAVFFQDELDFGNSTPRWSSEVSNEFKLRKGYDLEPELAALWFDLGPRTQKLRIDYADVVTQLSEEHYFKPVFDWHERHGTLFGHDNLGRGDMAEGHRAYGDYFRTMRWFSAPGTDDPYLQGPRRFAGFKVNSSIAHLYGRPRVWNEGFYGSGWGVTPEQLLAALNEDFVYGATLFNPHAVYYTTFGGWWEWASPDFHFRQPYWPLTGPLWKYVTRLSFLLSSGCHQCDVAVLYPITDLEAGFGGAEETAAGFGRRAMDDGLDFDFIDFESLERAVVSGKSHAADKSHAVGESHVFDNSHGAGELRVAGGSYRALVFPAVRAVRHSSLVKALEFKRAGGVVIALGFAPTCTEQNGRDDPELAAMLEELFDGNIVADEVAALEYLNNHLERDFVTDTANVCALHRMIDGLDAYFVFNRSNQRRHVTAQFRAKGQAELWDAWTGEARPAMVVTLEGSQQRIELILEPHAAQLVVFSQDAAPSLPTAQVEVSRRMLEFPKNWQTQIVPILDNRHGDFRQPPEPTLVGPELRRFRHIEEAAETRETEANPVWAAPDLDDGIWQEVQAGYGPRFWRLGPVPTTVDLEALEQHLFTLERIEPNLSLEFAGVRLAWSEYGFSERFGIEGDPLLKHWLTGPHGLKGQVPDEFIDVGEANPATAGWQVYLWTSFDAPRAETVTLTAGSRAAYRVWLEGQEVISQDQSLGAGRYEPWSIPDYGALLRQGNGRSREGHNRLLLRLTLESDQRTRAFVVVGNGTDEPDVEPAALGLDWFSGEHAVHFDHRPTESPRVEWLRCLAPPGTRRLWVAAHGSLRAWLGGELLKVVREGLTDSGARCYRLEVASDRPEAAILALRIEPDAGRCGGAMLAEPVRLECGRGSAPLGDWAQIGLSGYSGAVRYRSSLHLEGPPFGTRAELSLGRVLAAARVTVNGREAGICLATPWTLDVTEFLREGENEFEILVTNTLANHLSDTPTPYVLEGQTAAGLFGPVSLTLIVPQVGLDHFREP